MSSRPSFRNRLGSFTAIGALVAAITGITIAALGSFGVFSGLTAVRYAKPTPTAVEIEATLMRVGISVETLAAAGANTIDATNVGNDAQAHLDATTWSALQTADSKVSGARRDLARLDKLARAGQASQRDLTQLSTAHSTLTNQSATRDRVLNQLFDAATADLDPRQVAALKTMHANRGRTVPIQYTVTNRTDAEWTMLRNALANIKTAGMCNEDADAECNQLVLECNAETAVAAAKTSLDNNLTAITTALRKASQD